MTDTTKNMDIRQARKVAQKVDACETVSYTDACAAFRRLDRGAKDADYKTWNEDKRLCRLLLDVAASGLWGNTPLDMRS